MVYTSMGKPVKLNAPVKQTRLKKVSETGHIPRVMQATGGGTGLSFTDFDALSSPKMINIRSTMSFMSVLSVLSIGSIGGFASFGSLASVGSLFSVGSVLSMFSTYSVLAFGCNNEYLKVCVDWFDTNTNLEKDENYWKAYITGREMTGFYVEWWKRGMAFRLLDGYAIRYSAKAGYGIWAQERMQEAWWLDTNNAMPDFMMEFTSFTANESKLVLHMARPTNTFEKSIAHDYTYASYDQRNMTDADDGFLASIQWIFSELEHKTVVFSEGGLTAYFGNSPVGGLTHTGYVWTTPKNTMYVNGTIIPFNRNSEISFWKAS